MSTRQGGVSRPPFDSLNLRPPGLRGDATDDPAAVHDNQRRFAQAIGAQPVWLDQVHGHAVEVLGPGHHLPGHALPRADASITRQPGVACAVLVADCLPVLLCSRQGTVVGAAHAGWRGLASGVLDATVAAMCESANLTPADLMAWLGPCIGPSAFEVGADVLEAFGVPAVAADAPHFHHAPRPDGSPRWLADLAGLARARLQALGLTDVTGGLWCTVSDVSRFFSFRRDRVTGRMAAGIALMHG